MADQAESQRSQLLEPLRMHAISRVCLMFSAILFLTGTQSQAEPAPHTLRIASVSFVPQKWDKRANCERIEALIHNAADQGAQLVITPEGALDGYVVNDVIYEKDPTIKAELTTRFQQLAEPINGPWIRRIAEAARRHKVSVILGVLLREDDQTTRNSSVLLGPDGSVQGLYHKTHFHQGYDINPPGYTPGDQYPTFDVGPARLGMMICFDRQLPEPARMLAVAGANLIVCPAYGSTGDWNTRMMQVRAHENDVFVVFTHPKQSLVISPDGDLLAAKDGDSVTVQDLNLAPQPARRQSFRFRRPRTYRDATVVQP